MQEVEQRDRRGRGEHRLRTGERVLDVAKGAREQLVNALQRGAGAGFEILHHFRRAFERVSERFRVAIDNG